MFNLPPSLTRHFQDNMGNFDPIALLRTPDEELMAIAREMPQDELVDLYWRLVHLRLGWVERLMTQAAGVDVDSQRYRFLRILEQAAG